MFDQEKAYGKYKTLYDVNDNLLKKLLGIASRIYSQNSTIVLYGINVYGQIMTELIPGNIKFCIDKHSQETALNGIAIHRPEKLAYDKTFDEIVITYGPGGIIAGELVENFGVTQPITKLIRRKTFFIDIVNRCNLRCPSCPTGRQEHLNGKKLEYMDVELFARIIDKISHEYSTYNIINIMLFNWTEPLLHPQIFDIIKIINAKGFTSNISTNLNVSVDTELLAKAGLDLIKISLSGFTQETYQSGHRGGNIENVKSRMVQLSESLKKRKSATKVIVSYHRYLTNLDEEKLMQDFCTSLGFELEPSWACYMTMKDHDALDDKERFFIDKNLTYDIRDILRFIKENDFSSDFCAVQDEEIVLDHQGNVQLCCGVLTNGKYNIGRFLDLDEGEVEKGMKNHPYCTVCKKRGINVFARYYENLELRTYFDKMIKSKLPPTFKPPKGYHYV